MTRKALMLTLLGIIGLLSFGIAAAQEVTPEVIPPAEVLPVGTPEPNLENVTSNHEAFYGQEVTLNGVIQEFVNARTFVLGEGAALDDDKVLVINNSGAELYLWIQKNVPVTVTGIVYPSINEGGLGQIASGSPGVAMPTVEALAPGLSEATLEPTIATEGDSSGGEVATEEAAGGAAATEDTSGGAMETLEAPSLDDSGAAATEEIAGDAMATEDTSGAMATEEMPGDEMATEEATAPASGDVTATEEAAPMPTMVPTAEPIDFSTMTLPEEYGDFTIIVISSVDAVVYVEPAAQ